MIKYYDIASHTYAMHYIAFTFCEYEIMKIRPYRERNFSSILRELLKVLIILNAKLQ